MNVAHASVERVPIDRLRFPGERRALVLCLLAAPVTLVLVSLVLPSVSPSEFVLLVAAGLLFVAVARGRLIGSSIRVEARQFPDLSRRVATLAARVGIPAPFVFLRDDQQTPIAAVGVGEPYALVISSQYFELLSNDELDFLIARELGHIASGHTRFASLLSISGRENPVVALVFGAWLRRTELTADRVGFVCSNDLGDAFGAICVTTFHAVGRRVDRAVLAEQRAEIASDPALRLGELIAGVPYATTRLDALRAFASTPLATQARASLRAADVSAQPGEDARTDLAPVRTRVAALVDLAVLSAIFHLSPKFTAIARPKNVAAQNESPFLHWVIAHAPVVHLGEWTVVVFACFLVYSAVLVGVVGQTLGMTVFDVRVVTTRSARPGLLRTLWRYVVAFGLLCSGIGVFCVWSRVFGHDFASGTRVVRARRAVAEG